MIHLKTQYFKSGQISVKYSIKISCSIKWEGADNTEEPFFKSISSRLTLSNLLLRSNIEKFCWGYFYFLTSFFIHEWGIFCHQNVINSFILKIFTFEKFCVSVFHCSPLSNKFQGLHTTLVKKCIKVFCFITENFTFNQLIPYLLYPYNPF